MAENSKIQWTHHTFNPWRGCTKVSPGCAHCYAETLSGRNPKTLGVWGPNGTRVVAAESYWREPLKWDAAAKTAGERHRVFCASLADVFEDWQRPMVDSQGREMQRGGNWPRNDGPCSAAGPVTMGDVRKRLFLLIAATPNLDWLLLTKRPEGITHRIVEAQYKMTDPELGAWTEAIERNVWLGTSVENQAVADERIPLLLTAPAAVHFLSMEPLLSEVRLKPEWMPHKFNREPSCDHCETCVGRPGWLESRPDRHGPFVSWVIVGGESGPGARPMHPDWARSLRDQCRAAGVPFHFKQWGEFIHPHPTELRLSPAPVTEWEGIMIQRVGKKEAGRLLDGRTWDELPPSPVHIHRPNPT